MSPRMIRGWCTAGRLWRGLAGTPIPGFGTAARTSRSEPGSVSASSAALDGAGAIGDLTGTTDTQCMTTTGITPAAAPFITGTTSTEAGATGAEVSTGPGKEPGLSTEIAGLLEDTPRPTVRAASIQAPSAATTVAGKQEASPHAEAPASAAAVFTAEEAAVVGIGNRGFVVVLAA